MGNNSENLNFSPQENENLFFEAINAVCSDINDIYYVDCETEEITIIRQAGKALGLDGINSKRIRYSVAAKAYVDNNVFIKDRESLMEHMRLDRIKSALKKEESISIFYRTYRDDELNYFRMKCIRVGTAADFNKIVFAFIPEDFKSSRSQLIRTLELDDITGVYNKQAFYLHAAELLDNNPDKSYDLIVSDIDNFKLVNRNYGRGTGDSVLKFLAERYDAAARGGLCARYGADQFIIFSEAMGDDELDMFHSLADMLCKVAPVPYLTMRYGIYRNVDRKDTIAEMCDKAMLALRSKNNSDDRITVYDRNVLQKHYRAQMYEADFERAIENREFVVWAQPKYNAFHRGMTSAEALVRWEMADGRFVSPGEFIPVFESDGLIVRLDEYVFRYVCMRQKEQLESGITPLPVSVNMSRATLFDPKLIEKYSNIVEEYNVPKNLVPIELTESATIENVQINGLIQGLKKAGFVLHLDDFGTGYSSLSSLSELHMDVLKLDKSLIDSIGNAGGDEILRHIIELAHFFQMEVVAEGVERDEQYNFLRKLSCDTIQGFLFSKPVPFDEYLELRDGQPERAAEIFDGDALADEASIGSLRITNDYKLQYLTALARIYMTMHVIDLKEDTVVEFATTTNVKEHCNRAHNCVAQMKAAMSATVAPEYLDAVLRFTDLTTIAYRMRGKKTISEEFVGKHFGWFRARFITVTTNENDEPEKLIYTTQVIEADRRDEKETISVCRTDELTGVYNRSAFEEDIKSLELTSDLVLMSVDINGLKSVNERFGPSAGDELVWGTADCLNSILGKGCQIYRLEGDKFVAVFRGGPARIEKVRFDFENAVHNWMGNEIRSLSTSYGFATRQKFPDFQLEELLEEANSQRLKYKEQITAGSQTSETAKGTEGR